MYVALGTCSNITYTVQAVFHFSSNPSEAHWKAVKQIYCYFLGTKNLWLYYSRKTKELVDYTDTNRIIAKDCHTISRYIFMLYSRTISQSTKQQKIILLFTTESEYIAAIYAIKEAL